MNQAISQPDTDAIVIGAGITGIYQVYQLRQQGLSVLGIEAGADVGGTWYWNRYPGCRLDTESYAYGYFALKGIVDPWPWSERFAGQAELLRYVRHAADQMQVRPHYRFNARVLKAHYLEDEELWRVELDDASVLRCRYLISAVGPLSAARMPRIEGMDRFRGESFHSSRWPADAQDQGRQVDFTGKRVGVIGTGATGVQIIPIVARTARQLHVFQRTPNWCTPLGNHGLDAEKLRQLMGDPKEFLAFIETTETAFPYRRHDKKATEVSREEREQLFESLYDMPGYGIWLSGYRDLLTNKVSNQFLGDFIAHKIRQRVRDPVIAEKLIPRNHAFGTRRVPMETNYYEVYNQDNVELVDVSETPIQAITAEGIEVGGRHIELDVLVYATGFDGVTGSLDRIDIRGRQGQRLTDAWAEGPVTYLGLQTAGFPNFFTLVGAHNGAAFCNIGVCGALQVEWVSGLIAHMQQRHLTLCEPDLHYQDRWTEHVYQVYAKTLLADSDAWWVKTTQRPDGSLQRRALIYIGGAPEYRAHCREVAEKGYKGFVLQ